MAVNQFVQLASGVGADVEAIASWLLETGLIGNGFPSGIMLSSQLNRAFRQATLAAALLGQLINDDAADDALDDGNLTNITTSLKKAIQARILGTAVYTDVGAVNALAVNASIAIPAAAVTDAFQIKVRAANNNTSATPTFSSRPGETPATITRWDGGALKANDIVANRVYTFSRRSGTWRIQGFVASDAAAASISSALFSGPTSAATLITPSGPLLWQWGSVSSVPAGSSSDVTLPFAYGSASFAVIAGAASSTFNGRDLAAQAITVSVLRIFNGNPTNNCAAIWTAIGEGV